MVWTGEIFKAVSEYIDTARKKREYEQFHKYEMWRDGFI